MPYPQFPHLWMGMQGVSLQFWDSLGRNSWAMSAAALFPREMKLIMHFSDSILCAHNSSVNWSWCWVNGRGAEPKEPTIQWATKKHSNTHGRLEKCQGHQGHEQIKGVQSIMSSGAQSRLWDASCWCCWNRRTCHRGLVKLRRAF